MRNHILIFFVLCIFFFLFIFLSQQKQQNTSNRGVTIITPPTEQVNVTSGNTKCKAIHVDQSDSQAYLPDSNCTPGSVNPDVTQDNIDNTICSRGYTKTIRPPVSYTEPLKLKQIQQYGYTDTNPRDYEEDHFISLELGGNPTDPKNLWPEPHPSTNEKDLVEDYLHKQVCEWNIPLAEAQKEITQNWYTIYQQIK